MMARSDLPAFAAAVARPARREWPPNFDVSHARTHVLNTLEEPTEQGVWAWLPGILNAASAKPKWMRWLTFERLTEQHDALVARSAAAPLASGA